MLVSDVSDLQQVLSIGETVEEVSDSGFLAQAPTLETQLLADDSMLQVCPLTLHGITPVPSCTDLFWSLCPAAFILSFQLYSIL